MSESVSRFSGEGLAALRVLQRVRTGRHPDQQRQGDGEDRKVCGPEALPTVEVLAQCSDYESDDGKQIAAHGADYEGPS